MDAMVNKWKTGRRRVLDLVPSRPARWPARAAQRRELLEAWRYVAAQMLRRNRVNLSPAASTGRIDRVDRHRRGAS